MKLAQLFVYGTCIAALELVSGCMLSDPVFVTELELENSSDGVGDLEINLYLEDADTGEFLGCAGELHGLRKVTESGVLYTLRAHFVSPDAPLTRDAPIDDWLTVWDLRKRNLVVVAIEDDGEQCPLPYGAFDDQLGVSPTFTSSELDDSSVTLTFGRVRRLLIGT